MEQNDFREEEVQDNIEEEEVSASPALEGGASAFPALALETRRREDLKHKKNDQKDVEKENEEKIEWLCKYLMKDTKESDDDDLPEENIEQDSPSHANANVRQGDKMRKEVIKEKVITHTKFQRDLIFNHISIFSNQET